MKIIKGVAVVIAMAGLGSMGYELRQWHIRETCESAVVDELHWEWRLRTKEVQDDQYVKDVTKDLYDKSVQERIEKCTRMYEEGAE